MDDIVDRNLSALANEDGPLYAPTGRIQRQRKSGLSRTDVIQTFQHAFEMIGGVPRLAVWADSNPSDFFKLYGRLLPTSNSSELDGPQELIVRHVLAPPRYSNSGAEDNRAQLSAPRDIQGLPSEIPALGDRSSASSRRENSGDDQ